METRVYVYTLILAAEDWDALEGDFSGLAALEEEVAAVPGLQMISMDVRECTVTVPTLVAGSGANAESLDQQP